MKSTCIASDLDYTLYYFKNGYGGIFDIFTKRGIPKETAEQVYRETADRGEFCIQELIDNLKRKVNQLADEDACKREFEIWLKDSLALYPDVPLFLSRREKPFAIVTNGNADYQKQKMDVLNIKCNNFYAVSGKGKKVQPLMTLLERYGKPITFIDDRPFELDKIRETGISETQIMTYLIRRANSPYRDEPAHYLHREIESLEEIL